MFDKYKRLVFFDIESSGLSAEKDTITEFAALILEKQEDGRFAQIEEIDVFVKQPKELPFNIIKLTGITDEMCEKQGLYPEVLYENYLSRIFEDKDNLIIAHNAPFDKKFINAYMINSRIKCDSLDTLVVAKRITGKLKGNKLADMINYYDIKGVKNSHRAIDDVYALLEVTRRMWADLKNLDIYIEENYS